MKQLIVGIVCLWSLFPIYSAAQRGGGARGGGARGGGGAGFRGSAGPHRGSFVGSGFQGNRGFGDGSIRAGFNGLPPVGPIPPLGSFRNFSQSISFDPLRKGGKGGNVGDGFFPFGYGYLDTGYYAAGQQGPVIVLAPQEPFVPPPPPPPPQPEVHEYSWTQAGNDPSAVFSIVSTDGNNYSAVAVWVQGNTVRYIAPDGGAGQLPLNSVDRAATRMANAARNLTLVLPTGSGGRR